MQEGPAARGSALILATASWSVAVTSLFGSLREADVAVADLDEREIAARRGRRPAPKAARREDAAADRPEQAGAGPGHAFEEPAAVDAVALVIVVVVICHRYDSSVVAEGQDPNSALGMVNASRR